MKGAAVSVSAVPLCVYNFLINMLYCVYSIFFISEK